ncbi:hypothetical protein [Bacillus pseudomycoides]|uniref:hypothetical protein n=1 Tax=Bacillus pseudomycoides TaxID=64104 RepID=UPI001CD5B51D|nr:hypothetical protein [Bacillus pseudomycoides]
MQGYLYEGRSCNTTDLDGEYPGEGRWKEFFVSPGGRYNWEFGMQNDNEGDPEDRTEINFSVTNTSLH